MTRLIGKLSKLSKYSASWSIVCTRLQTQAHVVIFLTLGELNKQQSQPTSEEAGGIALLRPHKRPKEGEALQELVTAPPPSALTRVLQTVCRSRASASADWRPLRT